MNMFSKIIAVIFIIYGVIAIIYSAFIETNRCIKRIHKLINNIKANKFYKNIAATKENFVKEIKRYLLKAISINSLIQVEVIIWGMSISILIMLPKEYCDNFFVRIVIIVCMGLFLIGVGRFLSYKRKTQSYLDKIQSYLIKFIIFISYSLMFFMVFLEKLDNNILFILAICMLLMYSICFLKYVIDDFKSFIFLIFNLIFIYLYNLLIIGFTFGIFYLNNNSVYNLFENPNSVVSEVTLYNIMKIVSRGLYYFYTYSHILNVNEVFKDCVPFLQYIFGSMFNITIIGFFISYSASKAFTKNEDKNLKTIEQ